MWFDRAAFVFPGATAAAPLMPPLSPIGRFGNSGVGILAGPRLWQFDLGLVRSTAIGENMHLRLSVFASNLLNHPNLANPSMDISVPSTAGRVFGVRQVPEASGPGAGIRILTLGARLEF
jgi:hypothetical protein